MFNVKDNAVYYVAFVRKWKKYRECENTVR